MRKNLNVRTFDGGAVAPPGNRRGPGAAFTLIELVVSIVLAGIVLLALVAPFHEEALLQEADRRLRAATLLAGQLMNEVRSRSFSDPQSPASFGLEEAVPRANFDDVDDYDDWASSPPQTIEGTPLAGYDDFTENVIVENVASDDLNTETPLADGATPFKRITVVVYKGEYKTVIIRGQPVTVSVPSVVITNRSVVGQYD